MFSKEAAMSFQALVPPPSKAFVASSWAALGIGAGSFLLGLWNSSLGLGDTGYLFLSLCYGLFAAVSLQKSVRDRNEGIHVTNQYFMICWLSFGIAVSALLVNLFEAKLQLSEKGFFGIAFLMCIFGVIAVQKNVRDLAIVERRRQAVAEQRERAA